MKNLKKMIILVLVIISFAKMGYAANILGCPNGIMKGVIWPRVGLKFINATQKYDFGKSEMVDIDKGNGLHKMSKKLVGFRLGYGLTSKIDIGTVIKYVTVDKEKKTPSGINKIEESGFTDLWLSGKYRFFEVHKKEIFDYAKFSIGACYKFPLCNDNEKICNSLTKGEDEMKIGFIHHEGIKGIDFAGHFLYIYRGRAKEITNEQGNHMYGKSGIELSDRFNYMLKTEYCLCEKLEAGLGVNGWMNLKDEGTWVQNTKKKEQFYSHNIDASIHFRPWGNDYEKRKIYVHFGIPYKVKNNTAPDYTLSIGLMYTFY
ncbi:MAG: hypothetical protein U9P79_08020 [Candidatus Cloacimonadota bacterium]|nr:hypothetical protein [Candidatus Cloacimonadota bacterium]